MLGVLDEALPREIREIRVKAGGKADAAAGAKAGAKPLATGVISEGKGVRARRGRLGWRVRETRSSRLLVLSCMSRLSRWRSPVAPPHAAPPPHTAHPRQQREAQRKPRATA